jgi:putative endonuclease
MLDRSYFVYLLASRRNGTLYIGVTNDLVRRVWEHKQGLVEGFTKEYGVKQLVWFEQTESIESAIQREKQIKKWNRAWKLELIEKSNPAWKDLYDEIAA